MQKLSGKRTLHIMPLLLCLVAMLVTACGGGSGSSSSSATKASADKQVFTFPLDGYANISTFDPALSTDFASITAIDTVFTGLVQLDDKLTVRPQLAQSWQASSDGLTYTFTMKPNLKFSDGTPLTSKDVAYSIDRALQPATKSLTAPAYLNLVKDSDKLLSGKIKTIIGDSLKTPDDNTISITINKKAAYFLEALTYSSSYVVEKSLVEKYGNNFTDHLSEGGGAGPFKVQSFNNSSGITLIPNANYYGPKPQLSKLIIPFYKEVATGYKAYQAGQADYAYVPTADLASARAKADEFHKVPQLWINYYGMNYLIKPFNNVKIREAFDLALNKEEIVHAVWKDLYTATNHIVPEGMPGYNQNLTAPDGKASTSGDPTMAKQLLQQGMQEEGYSSISQLPSITMQYPAGNKDAENEINAAVQTWQTVLGVSVKTNSVDFSKLVDEVNNNPNNASGLQMWAIAWIADYPDPQDWLTLQFDKSAPNNNTNYGQNKSKSASEQQANQQAMEQADGMSDNTARMSNYNQAEQKLVNDVAWLPMTQVNQAIMVKSYVKGLVLNAQLETPPDDWANVYITTH